MWENDSEEKTHCERSPSLGRQYFSSPESYTFTHSYNFTYLYSMLHVNVFYISVGGNTGILESPPGLPQ